MPKYLKIILFFFIFACTSSSRVYDQNGFASVSKTNEITSKLPSGTLVKIINLQNKKSLIAKTTRKNSKLISRVVSIPETYFDNLNLDKKLPFVRVVSIRENKKFIAKRAKIYEEEKRVKNKVKFNSVEIVNLNKKEENSKKIYLNYGPFYFQTYADGLYKILSLNLKNKNILYKDYKTKNYNISVGPVNNLKEYDNLHKSLGALGLIGYEVKIKWK